MLVAARGRRPQIYLRNVSILLYQLILSVVCLFLFHQNATVVSTQHCFYLNSSYFLFLSVKPICEIQTLFNAIPLMQQRNLTYVKHTALTIDH